MSSRTFWKTKAIVARRNVTKIKGQKEVIPSLMNDRR